MLRHIRYTADRQYICRPKHNIEPPWLKDSELTIYGDSQLVIYQMIGKYKVREENLRPLWLEAINLSIVLKNNFNVSITFKWIERELNNFALNLNGKIDDPHPQIESHQFEKSSL